MRYRFFFSIIFLSTAISAQTDSLRLSYTTIKPQINCFKSRYVQESIVPVALAATSLTIMAIPGLKEKIQQRLNWDSGMIKLSDGTLISNPDAIVLGEDYLRYAPAVAAYILSDALTDYGFRPKHKFINRSIILVVSYIASDFVVNNTKNLTKELRPLGDANNSFPSQHTAMAFVAASFLDHELGYISPWISVGGYAVASYVGYARVARNAHFTCDVLMGAAVGMIMTNATYWAYDGVMKLFPEKLTISPIVNLQQTGVYICYKF